jgi:molybdopterin molybdotransferase
MTNTMRPIKDTIPLDEARSIIAGLAWPLTRTDTVALDEAGGRVVAVELTAPADVPPFPRAAMDGYALIAEDTFGATRDDPRVLTCVDRVFTGQVPATPVTPGTCVEIATGAPMPPGADAVLQVEETERHGDQVHMLTPVYPKQNVGRQGADIAAGQVVLKPGDLLLPSRVGAAAALGLAEITVFARPTVAVLSTGNEVARPGAPLQPGQIYDINRYTLSTIVNAHGGVAVPYATAQDTLEDLERAVDACLANDVLVFSGGSSVGERDLILDVIASRGELLFHGIALKPGKPTVFGVIGGKPVFGLPGYPSSCLSNAYLLLVPFVRALAHLPPYVPRTVSLPIGKRIVSTTGRHQFYTVRIQDGEAVPAFKASGDITSMSQADGYIEIPAQVDIVEKGETVEVKLF